MNDLASLTAVFHSPGSPIELRRVPVPALEAGEVLVRVTCTTLCGSDLHTYAGRRTGPTPTILGHEILGEVLAFGAGPTPNTLDGKPLAIGDRITWSIAASCGNCSCCSRGLPQKCDHLFKYGHEPDDTTHALSGGLAEHCVLRRGTAIVGVPRALDDRVACPANCATATVAAIADAAGDFRDANVLVQGAGMLGVTACAMARWLGANEIIAADPVERRVELARSFGASASVVIGADGNDALEEVVAEATDGRGVDIAIEVSGSPDAIERGLPRLREAGRYVWAGSVFPARPASIPAETVVRRLLTLRGVHNYAPRDLARAVEFLVDAHTQYPFAELVPRSFPLPEVESAFQHAIRERPLRVAVSAADER